MRELVIPEKQKKVNLKKFLNISKKTLLTFWDDSSPNRKIKNIYTLGWLLNLT